MSDDDLFFDSDDDDDDDITDFDDESSVDSDEDEDEEEVVQSTKAADLEAAQKAKIARRKIEQMREEKELQDRLSDYHLLDDD